MSIEAVITPLDSHAAVGYSAEAMSSRLNLTEILGAPVFDSSGAEAGRVREVALCPQEDPTRISLLVVKTREGERVITPAQISSINGDVRARISSADFAAFTGPEGYFLLDRDLLDQQIID